jgi:hypothetical protein
MLEEVRPLYARKHPARVDTIWVAPMTKAVAKWMKAAGRYDADAWESTIDLYTSWRAWCATHEKNLSPGGPARFCQIISRSLVAQRRKAARGWAGFRLKSGGAG